MPISLGSAENTWTPVIKGSTTAGTQTYGTQTGIYQKTGSLLWVQGSVRLTAKDAATAGNILVGNFPFAPRVDVVIPLGVFAQVDLSAGYTTLALYISAGTTDAFLMQNGDLVANAVLVAAALQATTNLVFNGAYLV